MSNTTQMTIDLSVKETTAAELAIGEGRFDDVQEALRYGVSRLVDEQYWFDEYMRTVVVPRYEEFLTDRSKGYTLEEAEAYLQARRDERRRRAA